MNNQIKPRLTKSCISSKNILDLCYFTIFNKNIIDNIKLYLIEYTYGYFIFILRINIKIKALILF